MERDIDVKFGEIYINMKRSDETDKEDKMNKKLLDEKDSQSDSLCCKNFLERLSSCCFFLYI